ncbi:MAG: bifunctional oligoribonuclease/PAP phosphatase NrnA [Bacteroidales bacterium]
MGTVKEIRQEFHNFGPKIQTLKISEDIIKRIHGRERIVITSHHNPDGDAIGSVLAMHLYLKKLGHTPVMIVPSPYPDFLKWLPDNHLINVYQHSKERCDEEIRNADIIFCLDYNALNRAGQMEDPIRGSTAFRILIDHHPDPDTGHFDLICSETETSSTAELVYDFILANGDRDKIDKDIAGCIYTGIMTDTGSFSYACNHAKTYIVVANLFETGIDGERIHRKVYDTFSEDRLRLLGYCLSEKLVVLKEYGTAYITLSSEELKRFRFRTGDTEGIVNYALSIKGINLAVMFTEKKDKIRLSFRSKGDFRVNVFSRDHFDGGGHRNAAGGDSNLSMEQSVERFRELLPKYRNELLKED